VPGVRLHLHIRQLVIDAGSPQLGAVRDASFADALREALRAQIAGGTDLERGATVQQHVELSLPQRIAAQIVRHEAMQPARAAAAEGRSSRETRDAVSARRQP
jgi:hypothetical protein